MRPPPVMVRDLLKGGCSAPRPIPVEGARESWSREEIEGYQLAEVRRVVRHAWDHAPGYRRLYEDAGVDPDTIASLDDLRSFPTVDKEAIRDRQFVLRGLPIDGPDHIRYFPEFEELRCSSYHLTPECMERFRLAALDYLPEWIRCYPSSGHIFARFLKETGGLSRRSRGSSARRRISTRSRRSG